MPWTNERHVTELKMKAPALSFKKIPKKKKRKKKKKKKKKQRQEKYLWLLRQGGQ